MSVQAAVLAEAVLSEIGLRKNLFDDCDRRARQIESDLKSTWVELSDICMTVRDSQLWREGGYESYNGWMISALPMSRSYAYAAVGIREELTDIAIDDLRQIPLGNAKILQETPRIRRSGHLVQQAKEQPPREFIGTVIESAPEAHLEEKYCHKFRLTTSQSKTLQAGFDMWRILNDDPEAPATASLEGIVADYMLSHQEEYQQKIAHD